ncbi:hypothetical protein BASA60_001495 [Batrachochytrium salamandrivorans]|nr:hypothetical protein BASA60_001495 [Batrachochytrium salamandrivorans]
MRLCTLVVVAVTTITTAALPTQMVLYSPAGSSSPSSDDDLLSYPSQTVQKPAADSSVSTGKAQSWYPWDHTQHWREHWREHIDRVVSLPETALNRRRQLDTPARVRSRPSPLNALHTTDPQRPSTSLARNQILHSYQLISPSSGSAVSISASSTTATTKAVAAESIAQVAANLPLLYRRSTPLQHNGQPEEALQQGESLNRTDTEHHTEDDLETKHPPMDQQPIATVAMGNSQKLVNTTVHPPLDNPIVFIPDQDEAPTNDSVHNILVVLAQIIGAIVGLSLVGLVTINTALLGRRLHSTPTASSDNTTRSNIMSPAVLSFEHAPVSDDAQTAVSLEPRGHDDDPLPPVRMIASPSDTSTIRQYSSAGSVATIATARYMMHEAASSFADTEVDFDLFQHVGRNSRSSLSTSMTDSTNYPQIPIVMPVPTRPGASVANRMTAALDAVNTFSRPEAFDDNLLPSASSRGDSWINDNASDTTSSLEGSEHKYGYAPDSFSPQSPNPHYHSTIMNQLEAQLEALNHDFDDTLYSSAARRYRRRSSAGASTLGHSSYSFSNSSVSSQAWDTAHAPSVRNRWLAPSSSDSSAGSINEKSYRLSWSTSGSFHSTLSVPDIPIISTARRFSLSVLPLPTTFKSAGFVRRGSHTHVGTHSGIADYFNTLDRSHLGVARSANDGPSLQPNSMLISPQTHNAPLHSNPTFSTTARPITWSERSFHPSLNCVEGAQQ